MFTGKGSRIERLHYHQQQGAVLIISLLILLSLTILGLAGVQSTALQSRMTSNQEDSSLAFQAASVALRRGEDFVRFTGPINEGRGTTRRALDNFLNVDECTDLPCNAYEMNAADIGDMEDQDWDWWSKGDNPRGIEYGQTILESVASAPRIIIEDMSRSPGNIGIGAISPDDLHQDTFAGGSQGQQALRFYRVTAYGVGASEDTKVILQTTVGVRF